MAISTEQAQQIVKLTVAMFDAPPGFVLGEAMAELIDGGMTIQDMANAFAATPTFTAIYPATFLSDEMFAGKVLDSLLGDYADAAYKATLVDALEPAVAVYGRGAFVYTLANLLSSVDESDPDLGLAAQAFNNKLEVANYYTFDKFLSAPTLEDLQAVLDGVTADDATVDAAIDLIDGVVPPVEADPLWLTVEFDNFTGANAGTAADDDFIADVLQNQLGIQVNTLGTGDRIDGGDGQDYLDAQLTIGAVYGDQNMPITPRTTDVETVLIDALNSGIYSTQNDVTLAEIVQRLYDVVDDFIDLPDILPGDMGPAEMLDLIMRVDWDFIDHFYDFTSGDINITAIKDYLLDVVTYADDINVTDVYLNAKNMVGIENIGSDESDANLIIQNLNTLADDGETIRSTSDMTISMLYTGNDDTRWAESDLHVYFDQDYLNRGTAVTTSQINYWLVDEDSSSFYGLGAGDAVDAWTTDEPLQNMERRGLVFTLDGVEVSLNLFTDAEIDELRDWDRSTPWAGDDYQTWVDRVNDALAAEIAAGNTDLIGLTCVLDTNNTDFTYNDEGAVLVLPAITIIDEFGRDMEPVGFIMLTGEIPPFDIYGRFDNDPSRIYDQLITVQVDLEKVGRGGEGGELVIGSMAKQFDDNTWQGISTIDSDNDGIADVPYGVEQFNVTVIGGDVLPNSLSALRSTKNTLEAVFVESVNPYNDDALADDDWADLTIGNLNTEGALGPIPSMANAAALKDVRIFDASGLGDPEVGQFHGNLTVYAAITEEVTAKYMDRQDIQDNPADDNIDFQYTGGTGDDYFNVALSSANYDDAGTTTREDFTFNLAGGDGDDTLVLGIVVENDLADDGIEGGAMVGGGIERGRANWYDNNKLMDNLFIEGNDGEDLIWTPGSGDVNIDAGANDDAVYSDNTGHKAIWAYNVQEGAPALHENLEDLQSDENETYLLYGATLQVNFKGFEGIIVDVPSGAGVVDGIYYAGGVTSDLHICQAFKEGINNDEVLNKWLLAEDGPGNTLVIYSLVDGYMEMFDPAGSGDSISYTLSAPDDLTSAELNSLRTWYDMPGASELNLITLFETSIVDFNAEGDFMDGFARQDTIMGGSIEHFGLFSNHACDNDTILNTDDADTNEADSGYTRGDEDGYLWGDVLTCSTGLYSNDTVVYEDFGNGYDNILYFISGLDEATEIVNTAVVEVTRQGTPAIAAGDDTLVPEIFTLEVTAAEGVAGTINFSLGGTVTIAADDTLADVVAAFLAPTVPYTTYTATAGPTPGTITFTETAPAGADIIPDVGVVDFAQSAGLSVCQAVVNDQDGATIPGTPAVSADTEVFTVTFGNSTLDTTYTFDGEQIPILAGETGANIAQAVYEGTYDNWTTAVAGNVVTFTYKTASVAVTDVTDADWVGANAEVVVDEAPVLGQDYIDFSWYTNDDDGVGGNGFDVTAVYVDGVLVTPAAPVGDEDSIDLVEDIENSGEYWIWLTEGEDDGDDYLIGIADFGRNMEQDTMFDQFIAETFILNMA